MQTNHQFQAADHEQGVAQRFDVEQQEAGKDDQRYQHQHDDQVGGFLHGVELVFRGGVMGIGSTQEIKEEIEEGLAQDAALDVSLVGDVDLHQVAGDYQIVGDP